MNCLLIILLTLHDLSAMKGTFYIEAEYLEFVVSIWYYHEHRCTGSLLNEIHVLTTGDCVFEIPFSLLSVAAGITQADRRDMQLISVKRIVFHPDFRRICLAHGLYWENNIAILEMSKPLRWEATIAAVSLLDVEFNWDPCYKCQIFGWDDTTEDGVKLLTLRWSLGVVLDDETCDDLNITLWKNEKCLKNQFQTVLDDEDHGAPVICGGFAVGMIVRSGAGDKKPSVLLSLYPYLEFIASVLLPMKINVPGQFPYYVVLFQNGHYRCGGSIIDNIHVVTAAHCVEGATRQTLIVLYGLSEFVIDDLTMNEFEFVDYIQTHPGYMHYKLSDGSVLLENDIAVVKLRAPLILTANVQPIGLADHLPVGQLCQVHRWSRTVTKKGKATAKSLSSPAAIRDYDGCNSINRFRQRTDFCVMNTYSLPIATSGDSGSPMVCDGLIVGVLSSHSLTRRISWGPVQGIYYTSIYSHLMFINEVVASANS